jgi:hypothetical protein
MEIMRYRLGTLLILMALVPMVLAYLWSALKPFPSTTPAELIHDGGGTMQFIDDPAQWPKD